MGGGCDPAGRVALRWPAGNRLSSPAEPGGRPQAQPEQEADHPPCFTAIARRGEGDRHGARIAWPNVGPPFPGPGGDRPGAPVGQRPQHKQRAHVHPLRPPRRPSTQRPRPRHPAALGPARRWPADRANDGGADIAEARLGPQHVRPGDIALTDRVGAPEGEPPPLHRDPWHDRAGRRHVARGLPRGRDVQQRPPSRSTRLHVNHVPVRVDRRRPSPVPHHRRAEERRRQSRQGRRRSRIGPRPSGDSKPSRHHHGGDCKRCTGSAHAQCSQPFPPAVDSLRPVRLRPSVLPRRGSSVGRAHD